jgi:protein-tyrosine phosphatase
MKAELHWIDGPWLGRLAIAGRPRGNEWLEDEVQGWKSSGIKTVVSFLTADEESDLGLREEERLSKLNGIGFIAFPVPDRSVPPDFARAIQLIRTIEGRLAEGKNVALHCRQGIGRSAVLAAALLVSAGLEPEAAFRRLAAARGSAVPETAEQRDWVIQFSREIAGVRR